MEYNNTMTATLEKNRITDQRAALERADQSLRLEGLSSSALAAPLFERLSRGEITPNELRAKLEAAYKAR